MESQTTSQLSAVRIPPDRESELIWLAFLLTGDMSLSGDVVGGALNAPVRCCRKLVIARALDKVRMALTASARRIRLRVQNSTDGDQLPPPTWSAGREVNRSQFEDALLAIDIFPRCSLLLRIFEKIATEDAVLLLNAEAQLVESATAIALNELAWNIAIGQDWSPIEATAGAPLVQKQDAVLA